MNILLVYPTSLDEKGHPKKYRKAFLPPLALALLARLTPNRHSVHVVNDIVENIDFEYDYDLIGITAMTTQIPRAYQIADRFRNRGITVVIGGIHVSMLSDEALLHADAVMVGEAEELWPKIVSDAECGLLEPIYRQEAGLSLTDAIIPRWDVMNMNIYPKRLGSRWPMMPIYTTRGCPYNCKFCSVTKFAGNTYRVRSVSAVQKELRASLGREFFFVDDNIGGHEEYSRELFEMVKKENVNWMSQISTRILKSPDLIDMAADSGCFYFFVGIESLNRSSLKSANKSFNDVDAYEELIARIKSAGIVPILSFIFGFDEDAEDQFERTMKFIRKNKIGCASFSILTPFPGTDLYNELSRHQRIEESDWSLYDGTNALYNPIKKSKNKLQQEYWNTYKKMYQLPQMLKNIYWNVMASNNPISELSRNILYQQMFKIKLRIDEHPFTGGIFRVQ